MDYIPLAALLILAGMLFGIFILLRSALVIKLQIKFYEMINWRISPVSMEKEVRNTKYMGIFLILFCLSASVYIGFFISA